MHSIKEKIESGEKMMKYLQIFIDFVFLLGHFKGGYLFPGWRISQKEPGNRIFRSSRCGLKKYDQKILFFRKVTTFCWAPFFGGQKSENTLEIAS